MPLAVDVRSAREVAVFDELTVVPRAAGHLRGVANLRGTIVPLVDIGPMLGLGASRSVRGITALLVQEGPVRVGIIVDAADGLEPFAHILPPSSGPGIEPRFALGLLPWRGGLIPLLDTRELVAVLAVELRRNDQAPVRIGAA